MAHYTYVKRARRDMELASGKSKVGTCRPDDASAEGRSLAPERGSMP